MNQNILAQLIITAIALPCCVIIFIFVDDPTIRTLAATSFGLGIGYWLKSPPEQSRRPEETTQPEIVVRQRRRKSE